MKKIITIIALAFFSHTSMAQNAVSVGTDIGLLRNFAKEQKFWSLGQTLVGNLHFAPKHSGYLLFTYFIPGKFSNEFTAVARDAATNPQQVQYRVNSSWALREFSVGYKYFFLGRFDAETGLNIYGQAGLGLMFAKAENNAVLDTVLYAPAPRPLIGSNKFNRLNLDLAIGGEVPLGGSIFIYSDLRTWINTSSYPSAVFHNEENATFPLMLHLGVRLLFSNW